MRMIRQRELTVAEEGQGSGDRPQVVRVADTVENEQRLADDRETLSLLGRQDTLRRRVRHRHHATMKHCARDFGEFVSAHQAVGAAPFGHPGAEHTHFGSLAFLVEQPDYPIRRLLE